MTRTIVELKEAYAQLGPRDKVDFTPEESQLFIAEHYRSLRADLLAEFGRRMGEYTTRAMASRKAGR